MKKLISILITVLLLTGCTNIFKDETTITVEIADSSRALPDENDSISKIEILIAKPSIVEEDSYFGFYTYDDDSQTYTINTELLLGPDSDVDFDENVVRYLSADGNALTFNIQIGVTKLFAVRVTYASDRVFTGGAEYTIFPHTTTLDFTVKESAMSSANQQIWEWDKEIDDPTNNL